MNTTSPQLMSERVGSSIPLSYFQKPSIEWIVRGGRSGFGSNISLSVRFRGVLSRSALCRALAFVMKRHESLRMRVIHHDGQLAQWFADPTESYDLPIVSVRDFEAAEAHVIARMQVHTDFEQGDGPLHAELLEIASEDHVLLLIVHHAATDAFADDLILREMLTAYASYVQGRAPSLPPAMSFTAYVQREVSAGEQLSEGHCSYWGDVLHGGMPAIPRRPDTSETFAGHGHIASSSTTSAQTQRLEDFATAIGVSLTTVLYTAIYLAAWKEFQLNDVSALVAYSGRDDARLKTLGAATVRCFPLRMALRGDMCLGDLVRKMQKATVRGSIASRPPFTPARALAQSSQASLARPKSTLAEEPQPVRVQLSIVDAMRIQRGLDSPIPELRVERVLPGPLLKDQFEITPPEGTSLRSDMGLNVILRRDISAELGRPITFLGVFHTGTIARDTARAFLARITNIAQSIQTENQNSPIEQLVS